MKLRIKRVVTESGTEYYIIQRKGLIFWHDVTDGLYGYSLTFPTEKAVSKKVEQLKQAGPPGVTYISA